AGEDRLAMRPQESPPRLAVASRCRRQAGLHEHVADGGRRDRDAELAHLADDPQVAPARVLARGTEHELTPLRLDPWSAWLAMRSRPAASDESAMPLQQRLRPHQERMPRAPRQHSTQRREEEPIARLEAWLSNLPTKNRQLVAEDENLQLLR